MQTTIYTDSTGFDLLEAEWNALLERAVTAPFFLTPTYQKTWWHYLGNGDLMLIAIRTNEGQLVGIAPLFTTINADNQRQLNIVGCVDVSDYLDLLVDRDYVEAVHKTLLACLATDQVNWDKLFLCSLPHNSATHTQFAEAAQALGWQAEVSEQDVCPVITLADSWDNYLARVKKKQRHEIRRKIRKIEAEADPKLLVIDSEEGLAEAMQEFIVLHQKSTTDKEDFWTEELTAFFNALTVEVAKAGWLRLYFIEVDGVKAAAMLCFDYKNEMLLYNSGYDPEQFAHLSPGNVLTSYTIQDSIELGRSRYDFLRGDEVYKFRFGAEPEPVYDVALVR